MRVKDLIKALEKYHEDTVVVLRCNDFYAQASAPYSANMAKGKWFKETIFYDDERVNKHNSTPVLVLR